MAKKDQVEDLIEDENEEIEEIDEIEDHEDPDGDPDGDPGEDPPQTDPGVEKEARVQGWVDLDEWVRRGNPADTHRSASEFVERGNKTITILRKRLDGAEQRLMQQEREFKERAERLDRGNKRAMQLQRERLEADFTARLREAVSEGDVETYDKLSKDRDEALKAYDEPEDTKESVNDGGDPVAAEWLRSNPWMNTDREMNAIANNTFLESQRENPDAPIEEHLARARARVVEIFPSAFPREAKQHKERTMADMKSEVEPGSRNGSGRNGADKSKASKLPAEARRAGQEFVEQGLYKDLDAYATEYFKQD